MRDCIRKYHKAFNNNPIFYNIYFYTTTEQKGIYNILRNNKILLWNQNPRIYHNTGLVAAQQSFTTFTYPLLKTIKYT